MLPSLDLYGVPRGTSNLADLRVTRCPSNDEVATQPGLMAGGSPEKAGGGLIPS